MLDRLREWLAQFGSSLGERVSRGWSFAQDWIRENPRSLHVYPGTLLLGWATWRAWSIYAAAAVVGGLLIYFGAFWRPPGSTQLRQGE